MSILTGMYPHNHGLWTNGVLLENQIATLADILSNQGYQTVSIGKAHLTPYLGNRGNPESIQHWQGHPPDSDWYGPYWGFQQIAFTVGHTMPLSHYGRWFRAKGGTDEMLELHSPDGDVVPGPSLGQLPQGAGKASGVRNIPAGLHDSSFVGERTSEFLRTRDNTRPFFAVASFPDPHHPFDPPREIAQLYAKKPIIPPIGDEKDLATRPTHYREHFRGGWHRRGAVPEAHPNGIPVGLTELRIAYTYAMVDLIDRSIGLITDTLQSEGLEEETIVLFTSDHGELLGDHGLWFKGPFFYEALLRVPLIIKAKGLLEPRISEELFSSVDIAPTLLDLLNLSIPGFMDGRSQKPHLLSPDISIRNHCMIEYHTGYLPNDRSSRGIVTKNIKYVHHSTGEEELTDLNSDPTESQNLVNERNYSNVISEMRRTLLDEIATMESISAEQISHA
jgi:arylsulfatase A-like enzyme